MFPHVSYHVDNELVDNIESLLELDVIDRPKKLELPESHAKLLPSCISPPKLELKPLFKNFKYAYLGDYKTLPLIISKALTLKQEDKLIGVLKKHSEVLR